MEEQPPRLTETGTQANGVMLTLDLGIQRACEAIAQQTIQKGCILVMERRTGRILASSSMPVFDPDNVADSIEANDTSLLNRPLCAFNVGSVFKPVMAALALEKDMGWFTWECTGSTEINGHVYHCAGNTAHGMVNLDSALTESCNCYFIQLGQLLGGKAIQEIAARFGFGETQTLAEGLSASAGNLPDANTLQNKGQLAGISFGQGELLATPLQVLSMMNAIANDGVFLDPSVLLGACTADGLRVIDPAEQTGQRKAISDSVAGRLQGILRRVVEEGTGRAASEVPGGAAGCLSPSHCLPLPQTRPCPAWQGACFSCGRSTRCPPPEAGAQTNANRCSAPLQSHLPLRRLRHRQEVPAHLPPSALLPSPLFRHTTGCGRLSLWICPSSCCS